MKAIAIVLILGLIAIAAIFPASAAGQGGSGKMLQNGSGAGTGVCLNPDCPQTDCPNNGTQPRDGTGMQYGKNRYS
ncbi:MAG: hypothetical protein LUQ50_10535 [Methanospirillum sp.]|uniref:hypothetical protein n=1 Tax=Methanospirillum sp. TaxID=45200 RepID=UPI0023726B98|nr:hypothetical protein [Methanospirillum sp.]MDD1729493.1 hypothetical protein [Methanospirillum sp.]